MARILWFYLIALTIGLVLENAAQMNMQQCIEDRMTQMEIRMGIQEEHLETIAYVLQRGRHK
jgi:hypothetical protein